MVKILILFLLLTPSLHAQKLVIDTIDPKTNKVVKESNWMKLRGTDKTRLSVKYRRTGSEVKLYLKEQVKNYDGLHNAQDNYVQFILDNNETLKIQMPTFEQICKMMDSSAAGELFDNRAVQPMDEPFGLPTFALTQEQLSLLQQHDIRSVNIYFFGHKNDIGIKQKDRGKLKAYAALLK
jgi:hypothetical protein